MYDVWSFLIQTLTATGAALLVLAVKVLLQDKLPPKWQFSIWGLVALVLLLPAGWLSPYTLLDWPLWVETLHAVCTGASILSPVAAPVPLWPGHAPVTLWDWLFWAYLAGVLGLALHYAFSYGRLRRILRQGTPPSPEMSARLQAVQAHYDLPACRAVQVEGLSSAFVCGVFRPVLALPAGQDTDEKVLLHELLHLKHRDVVWGVVICLFRCIHWCNPVLWYCANRAGNDMEARCDQRVLEHLSGEDRRDYGRILLSMANEAYPRAPGTSSAANGGKNIRLRIQAIARFKRYPAGMGLVSGCIAFLLLIPLVWGAPTAHAERLHLLEHPEPHLPFALTAAHMTPCTTYAGAIDCYAKALLAGDGFSRILCADDATQAALMQSIRENQQTGTRPLWHSDAPTLDASQPYYIYNMRETADGQIRGLLVLHGAPRPDLPEQQADLVTQEILVEQQGARWIVSPLQTPQLRTLPDNAFLWGSPDLPGLVCRGEGADFRVEVTTQTVCTVDNDLKPETDGWFFGGTPRQDLRPKPDAELDAVKISTYAMLYWLGSDADKDAIHSIGLSLAPWPEDEPRPRLTNPGPLDTGGSSSDGSNWAAQSLEPGWESPLSVGGGGYGGSGPDAWRAPPLRYAADLHVNGRPAAELTLQYEEVQP